jgi:molybdopterin-guanine dinucleotide biosynthesis protein A
MRTAALILAGGRGERLGGAVKANLRIGGVRLLERVSAALGPGVSPVLVAHGVVAPNDLGLLPGQIAVPDLVSDYAGPLAGVAGGLAWLASNAPEVELLVTAAVDTPFLPQGYVEMLTAALRPTDAGVIAAYGGQDYPTNALWRVGRIADLASRVLSGTAPRSLKQLALELGAGSLAWPASPEGDPFANANTPAELAKLERRAAG